MQIKQQTSGHNNMDANQHGDWVSFAMPMCRVPGTGTVWGFVGADLTLYLDIEVLYDVISPAVRSWSLVLSFSV